MTPMSWVMNSIAISSRLQSSRKQPENLNLYGDIERGGRLVGDQHLWPAGQRNRDHDPLALAAGQLMRIRRQLHRGVGHAHQFEQFARPDERRRARNPIMHAHGFGDLIADPHEPG